MAVISVDSPWGRLGVFERDEHIVALRWHVDEADGNSVVLVEAAKQLQAYIDGSLKQFDLTNRPSGGEFQQRVCEQMQAIPFGETRTYGDLAKSLDSMPQPVGQACGGNSIPIIIPCHRVLGANGLGGFSGAGGIETKISLLQHEDAFPYLL